MRQLTIFGIGPPDPGDVSDCEHCDRSVNWFVNTRCPNLDCPSRGDD